MKTMCPPGYQHNGFVATHALGHMMYGYIYIYKLRHWPSIAGMSPQSHCGDEEDGRIGLSS